MLRRSRSTARGARSVAPGEYFTLFGWITVERSVYQQAGRGRVAVPMDLRLGIVEKAYTPRVARVVTRATAVMTDEEAVDLLLEIGTAAVSKSTISRVSRAMAARYEQRRPVIEKSLRSGESIPSGAVTIQVALDGVMVPQDGEHARPRGRKPEEPDPHGTSCGTDRRLSRRLRAATAPAVARGMRPPWQLWRSSTPIGIAFTRSTTRECQSRSRRLWSPGRVDGRRGRASGDGRHDGAAGECGHGARWRRR